MYEYLVAGPPVRHGEMRAAGDVDVGDLGQLRYAFEAGEYEFRRSLGDQPARLAPHLHRDKRQAAEPFVRASHLFDGDERQRVRGR